MKAIILLLLLTALPAMACVPGDGNIVHSIAKEDEIGVWYYCDVPEGEWTNLYFEGKTRLEETPKRERIKDIVRDRVLLFPKLFKQPKV